VGQSYTYRGEESFFEPVIDIADPARKLDIGDAAILLQLLENLPVNGIETGGHSKGSEGMLAPIVSNTGPHLRNIIAQG